MMNTSAHAFSLIQVVMQFFLGLKLFVDCTLLRLFQLLERFVLR